MSGPCLGRLAWTIGLFLVLLPPSGPLRAAAPGDGELASPWLRLMHYQGPGQKLSSLIESSQFFMASQGELDPDRELKAQRRAFREREIMIAGETWDPLCAFPARARWLRENIDPGIPERPCPELDAWKSRLALRSLSMVYSSAYAGNSASMFGHNLLKINLSRPARLGGGEDLELLDYGVGFLAQTDPADKLLYAVKGLFGGYPGVFTLQPYYELVNTYAYAENRDLWELEIPLNETERLLFVEHLWELLHFASTPYYFTHINCSSMLVALIDVLKPAWRLKEELKGFVLPAVVMKSIAARLEPQTVEFRPSQRRLYRQQVADLSPVQRKDLLALESGEATPGETSDARVLAAALAALNLKKSERDRDEQVELRAYESQLLMARSRLAAQSYRPELRTASNNPLRAHAPQKVGLSLGSFARGDGPTLGLRWRYGWHDILDPLLGFDPYYQLNYLDLSLQMRPERAAAALDATLMEVWSLSPFFWDDPTKSWKLRGGSRVERDKGRDRVRTELEGAMGLAAELQSERSLIALLPTLRCGVWHEAGAPLFYTLSMEGLWLQRWSDRWQSLLSLQPGWQGGADPQRDDSYTAELRRRLGEDRQLSFALRLHQTASVQINWSQFL